MNKIKVFISYDFLADRAYKNLLLAWDANKRFEFYINSHPSEPPIESASKIRPVISGKIGESTVFLCLIGRKTYQSEWVDLEIENALSLNKDIVIAKIATEYILPIRLRDRMFRQADSFTYESISKALIFDYD